MILQQDSIVTIDFQKYEQLLLHTSRIANISIELHNLRNEVVVSAPGNSNGKSCTARNAEPGQCCAECIDISHQIRMSGKTRMKTCHDNFTIISVPIKFKQQLAAILHVCARADNGDGYKGIDKFLEEIAARITQEIEKEDEINNLATELSAKYEELSLIYDIGRTLGGISTAVEAIKFIVAQSKDTFDADLVLASIPKNHIFEISDGYPSPAPVDFSDKILMKKLDDLFLEKLSAAESDASIVINDVSADRQLHSLINAPLGLLAVPVKLKGEVAGFLCIINVDTQNPFETGDVKLARSLAEQISLSLTNAELYQNLKDFLLSVIKTLVSSIEAKDSYTKGHSERVNTLAMMIAEDMGLSQEEKEALNWASILHDIGKIGVSEKILTKPGKLIEEEFLRIKGHPEQGYRILEPIEQLRNSLSGIRHHHEKYDGTGYPSGLTGKDIPLYSRIIAVADTYDAMTSDRSYRAKVSHDRAIAEIDRVKGKQLDPDIAAIFIQKYKFEIPA